MIEKQNEQELKPYRGYRGKCGINLDHWLEGFKDTPESVRKTVETIKTHPLVPKDIVVRGFIIDSETGALEEIQ